MAKTLLEDNIDKRRAVGIRISRSNFYATKKEFAISRLSQAWLLKTVQLEIYQATVKLAHLHFTDLTYRLTLGNFHIDDGILEIIFYDSEVLVITKTKYYRFQCGVKFLGKVRSYG